MPRFFNTAGPCRSADHYMLPAERRLPDLRDLIAPRQSGKTTLVLSLAESLLAIRSTAR